MSENKKGPETDAPDVQTPENQSSGETASKPAETEKEQSGWSGASARAAQGEAVAQETGPAEEEAADESVVAPGEELDMLRQENAELKEQRLRIAAEMDNLRKRMAREQEKAQKYAIESFARSVLSIGDNMQRARAAVPDDALAEDGALKGILEGVEMTEREFLSILERHGVTPISPKGEPFDPNVHNAMMEVENTEVPAKTVVEVFQTGYMLADRVLRPAMVSVSRGGPKVASPASDEAPVAEAPGAGPADAATDSDERGGTKPEGGADEAGDGEPAVKSG